MDINNFRKVCVIGWGKSGVSLCKLLLSLKKQVKVSEKGQRQSFPSSLIDEFKNRGVEFEFGGNSENFIKDSQLVVLSPGVDTFNSSVVNAAGMYNIPCVGEIEFSWWLTKAKFIAITGTNGKTTTTSLIYQLLKKKNKRVFLGGNIGIPLSSFVLDTKEGDLIVLEISSFQLETIVKFKPYVASLLNISPDHLNRYADMDEYSRAKMNIFKNQGKDDWAVLNQNLDLSEDNKKSIKSKILRFSNEFSNENYSCVYRIGSIFGIDKSDCQDLFSSFKGMPHRMQLVREVRGINFINDSKATNPASTVWALKNLEGPVILIAGGKDKGLDFSQIKPYLKNVKKVNLFGESASKIEKLLQSDVDTAKHSSLEEIVFSSFQEAKEGDTILFSPMCASFDMFSNYAERGQKFMEIVNNL
jgi:UDP-N-acetylmuramoylalanine--D-glutamate ligase